MPDETIDQPKPAAGPSDTDLTGQAIPDTVPPPGVQASAAPSEEVPVGPPGYELGDVIGRGGMGVVHRARDLGLARDVAVKLLADKFPAGGPVARRFLEEAHITGQLQHPGIPAVHQAGTLPDGRPFLAMKLIKGRTLEDVLGERPDPGHDRGRFVAVFEKVCEAVGYAHAHGVIHRDLKPANVMVGAFGEVQVMDWGLAKVLAGGGLSVVGSDPDATLGTEIQSLRDADAGTQAGSVLGTPAYMPPEQAIGAVDEIDRRSDVFGLGAVLCAILTGKPPYIAGDAESTRKLAARAKLDDAHARLAWCGAESGLTALCERCLAADRDTRPADAGVVAAAVAKLRADADERARAAEIDAASVRVRAVEGQKRRAVQRTAAGVVIAVLAVGGGLAAWQAVRATNAEGETALQLGLTQAAEAVARGEAANARAAEMEAKAAETKAVGERDRAVAARERTWAAVEAMTSTRTGVALSTQDEVNPEQRKFLTDILPFYSEFAGEVATDVTARDRVARAALRIGLIFHKLGRREEGIDAYLTAGQRFAALADEFPKVPEYRRSLSISHNNRGMLLAHLGRREDATAAYRASLAIRESLVADYPAVPAYRHLVADTHNNIGVLLRTWGRDVEAEKTFRTGAALCEMLVNEFSSEPEFRSCLVMLLTNLGSCLTVQRGFFPLP